MEKPIKPEPSKPIPIPKPNSTPDTPVKPKSKAGRKRKVVPRMTIVKQPVEMAFD